MKQKQPNVMLIKCCDATMMLKGTTACNRYLIFEQLRGYDWHYGKHKFLLNRLPMFQIKQSSLFSFVSKLILRKQDVGHLYTAVVYLMLQPFDAPIIQNLKI